VYSSNILKKNTKEMTGIISMHVLTRQSGNNVPNFVVRTVHFGIKLSNDQRNAQAGRLHHTQET
jgi:hypothetical protein